MNGAASAKDAEIRLIKSELDRDFTNSLDCESVTINGTAATVLITKATDLTIKNVITRPDESIYLGDIVNWCDTDWIVHEIDADDRIHSRGKMRRCNVVMRWRDSDSITHAYPAFCEDATKYSEGITNNKQMQIPDFQIKVKLRLDKHSAKLNRDKRFLLDSVEFLPEIEASGSHPSAYIVTRRNVLTGSHDGHGYVELTLVECGYSEERDNAELMIADYTTPTSSESGWF